MAGGAGGDLFGGSDGARGTPWAVLLRRAERHADGELVRFGTGAPVLVGNLVAGAATVAARLAGLVRPGARVATCLTPGPEYLELIFGLARLGAVEVPLALDITADAAAAVLTATGAELLVIGTRAVAGNPALHARPDRGGVATDERELAPWTARRAAWTGLRARAHRTGFRLAGVDAVVVDEPGGAALPGVARLAELPTRPGRVPAAAPGPGDPLAVMATSGTTGRAKAAVLPGFAAVRHARRVAATMGYRPGEVLLNVFPWNHINVRHTGLLAALVSGARLVVAPRFSASGFWPMCRDEGVTAFNYMGAMLAILDRRPPAAHDRAHQVRLAYGAPAPPELAHRFRARFGVDALEAYACTELGDVASNTPEDWRPGSAGRPVPEYEVAILGADGRPVRTGEVGQIAARARRPHVMFTGYAGDPAATRAVLRGGWFHTGDRGRLDAEGYLYFAGRRADVVRRRGENIPTWDVEQAVNALPGVLDAAAVGVASELTEQEVLVVVSVEPGAALTGRAVWDGCRSRLPRHAVPRFVRLVTELPRNPNGKVLKPLLREHGVDRNTWDAELQPPTDG